MRQRSDVQALDEVIPAVAERQRAAGGTIVMRPDSGDPVEAVLMGLHAGLCSSAPDCP